jgi:glycerophosphoryl diester phosphodiesterase
MAAAESVPRDTPTFRATALSTALWSLVCGMMAARVLFFFMTFPLMATEIIAHRGASVRAPENTVAAFRLAWELETDACELDLQLTADGEIAVLHDKDTHRTAAIQKVVAETAMADLKKLDVGAWKDGMYSGEPIPTLMEALATLPEGKQRFFLEIKCGPEVVPVLAQQLQSWKPRAAQLCIIAFKRDVAQDAKKALPWLKVYRLSSELTKTKQPVDLKALIAETVADGLDGLDLSQDFPLDEESVKAVRAAGLELYLWTVNRPEVARRFLELGVDGLTTDDPVMLRRVLEKK